MQRPRGRRHSPISEELITGYWSGDVIRLARLAKEHFEAPDAQASRAGHRRAIFDETLRTKGTRRCGRDASGPG